MKHRIESWETRKEGEPEGFLRSMGTQVLCGRYLQFWVSRKSSQGLLVQRPHSDWQRFSRRPGVSAAASPFTAEDPRPDPGNGFGREGEQSGEHSLLIKPFLQQSRGGFRGGAVLIKITRELVEPFRKERMRADNSRKEQEKDIPARGITDSRIGKKNVN